MKNFEQAAKTNFDFEKSEIVFSVNPQVYPKDVIFKACYALIDKIYIFLDAPDKKEFMVYLKTKERVAKKQLETLRDEFLNELLNASVRKMVSQKNQKIVEYVVGGAINAALAKPQSPPAAVNKAEDEDIQAIEKEIAALKKELEKDANENYEDDPRNIRKPAK